MDTEARIARDQDEILFKDIVHAFWQYRIPVLLFVIGCTAAVLVMAYMVPKRYAALAIVSPVAASTNNQSGVLGSLSNNLAAIAGVSMTNDPKKVESIAILQSAALTRRYIQQNNLLPILYAAQWDSAHSKWKPTSPAKTPTLWKANDYFRKSVSTITTDVKTGLVTVTITWKDPALATAWANGLVQMANDFERDTAIKEAEQNIAYLTDEAAKTDVIGIKQVIYSLLETEFNKAMLAKGNREFAFKIIDPAVVPEKATYPNKLVWLLTALFSTISIAVFVVFCVVAWRKS